MFFVSLSSSWLSLQNSKKLMQKEEAEEAGEVEAGKEIELDPLFMYSIQKLCHKW